jgi:hypothetical protein
LSLARFRLFRAETLFNKCLLFSRASLKSSPGKISPAAGIGDISKSETEAIRSISPFKSKPQAGNLRLLPTKSFAQLSPEKRQPGERREQAQIENARRDRNQADSSNDPSHRPLNPQRTGDYNHNSGHNAQQATRAAGDESEKFVHFKPPLGFSENRCFAQKRNVSAMNSANFTPPSGTRPLRKRTEVAKHCNKTIRFSFSNLNELCHNKTRAVPSYEGFFYVLTAIHALHVIGGVIALGYLVRRNRQKTFSREETARRKSLLTVVGWYWHSMAGIWIVLLVLLAVWR